MYDIDKNGKRLQLFPHICNASYFYQPNGLRFRNTVSLACQHRLWVRIPHVILQSWLSRIVSILNEVLVVFSRHSCFLHQWKLITTKSNDIAESCIKRQTIMQSIIHADMKMYDRKMFKAFVMKYFL